jgi:hypothetical protein
LRHPTLVFVDRRVSGFFVNECGQYSNESMAIYQQLISADTVGARELNAQRAALSGQLVHLGEIEFSHSQMQ